MRCLLAALGDGIALVVGGASAATPMLAAVTERREVASAAASAQALRDPRSVPHRGVTFWLLGICLCGG